MIRVSNSTAITSVGAATGSSAVVREYLCLFTHDLRRKQKRWEDGRLKYHTFNKRVMVYDERGNFVGDMHWQSGWDFDVGEEVQLERGGVIVQVSDCVGQETQDLSELLDKRVQEREERLLEKEHRRTAPSGVGIPNHSLSSTGLDARVQQQTPRLPQIRHRPLTALLGTPTGQHARAAALSESPYDQRKQAVEATSASPSGPDRPDRPVKRRRLQEAPSSKMGYAQSLFGATLSLSGTPSSSLRSASRQTVPAVAVAGADAPLAPERCDVEAQPNSDSDQKERHDPGYLVTAERNASVGDARLKPPRAPLKALPRSFEQATANRAASRLFRHSPVNHLESSSLDLRLHQSNPLSEEVIDLTVSSENWDPMNPGVTSPDRGHSKTGQKESKETTGRVDEATKIYETNRNDFPEPTTPKEPAGVHTEVLEEQAPRLIRSRRTELHLKSRRKRGLLMLAEPVSIEAKAKPRVPHTHTAVTPSLAVEEEVQAWANLSDNDTFDYEATSSRGRLSCTLVETPDTHGTSREPVQYQSDAGADLLLVGTGGEGKSSDEAVGRERRKSGALCAAVDSHDGLGSSPKEAFPEGHSTGKLRSRQPPFVVSDNNTPDEGQQGDVPAQQNTAPAGKQRLRKTLTRLKQPATGSEDNVLGVRRPIGGGPVTEGSDCSEEGRPSITDSADGTSPARSVAPRLVKFGRRSVRSKEVIGFAMEDVAGSVGSQYRGLSASAVTSARHMTQTDKVGPEVEDTGRHMAAHRTIPEPERTPTRAAQKLSPRTTREKGTPGVAGCLVQVQPLMVLDTGARHQPAAPRARDPEGIRVASEEVVCAEDSMEPVPQLSEQAKHGKESEVEQQGFATRVELVLPAEETVEAKHPVGFGTSSVRSGGCVRAEGNVAPFLDIHGTLTVANPTPRIANPATRGRKAALKSHAAGQPPLPALPSDLMREGVQKAQPRVIAQEGNFSGIGAPRKRKMTYPGFVSAKEGGPWSREAHDLLEFVRPS
ncbi:hypothetical protein DL546_002214 [Coniochaeta pulveracea]|uniref:5'-3' DNA helicase ZGRF1-like N-terminal domain-containing protein n=1 Tax=Coniochaeta pulveracea TaxID=177199 RepID=A0A420XXW2_9PEZI|nr:hypothetical protein DL546_002214 [Coniochaeta pulveracea]